MAEGLGWLVARRAACGSRPASGARRWIALYFGVSWAMLAFPPPSRCAPCTISTASAARTASRWSSAAADCLRGWWRSSLAFRPPAPRFRSTVSSSRPARARTLATEFRRPRVRERAGARPGCFESLVGQAGRANVGMALVCQSKRLRLWSAAGACCIAAGVGATWIFIPVRAGGVFSFSCGDRHPFTGLIVRYRGWRCPARAKASRRGRRLATAHATTIPGVHARAGTQRSDVGQSMGNTCPHECDEGGITCAVPPDDFLLRGDAGAYGRRRHRVARHGLVPCRRPRGGGQRQGGADDRRASPAARRPSSIRTVSTWSSRCMCSISCRRHRKGKLPLLMWHGGGLTGVTYETTPDGREGWLNMFVRKGWDDLRLRRGRARPRRASRRPTCGHRSRSS